MQKRWGTLLLLALSLAFFAPARADNVNTIDALEIALKTSGGVATLTADLELNKTIRIEHAVTLDLHGKELKLKQNGLLQVVSGGHLTIQDSSNPAVNKGQGVALTPITDATDAGKYGIDASYDQDNGVLTWYVTESAADADKTHTTETTYTYTSDPAGGKNPMGRMVSDQAKTAVKVTGGRLTISGGAIYGFTNRAIHLSENATLVMDGGYLLGNEAKNTGAAIYAHNSNVTINGGVISGNHTGDSGTAWEGEVSRYGGAVCLEGTSIGAMNGGYLTNNHAQKPLYFDGGGALLIKDKSTFDLKGGYLTGNRSDSGGGAIRTGWNNETTFTMNGGYVSGNVAIGAEGGGISINRLATGFIKNGFVTNNITLSPTHWGGGGVFCSDGSWLIMEATLVMDNHAGGCGGGIAGCSTGRIDTDSVSIVDHGVAVFENTAEGEHFSGNGSAKDADHLYAMDSEVFMEEGYEDYFCALSSHVADIMLGGGNANWKGSADGVPVRVAPGGFIDASYVAGLTAQPSRQAKNDAIAKAGSGRSVTVSGNSAYTHGGGILCNGYLVFQTSEARTVEIGDRMELSGVKRVYNAQGNPVGESALEQMEGQFRFEIVDRNGKVVSLGANDRKGRIVFDRMLPFAKPGDYEFTIREQDPAGQIVRDGVEYRVTVNVQAHKDYYKNHGLSVTFNRIRKVKIEKKQGADGRYTTVYSDQDANSSDNSPYVPKKGDDEYKVEFKNYVADRTNVTVKKIWNGDMAHPQSVVVYLMKGTAEIEKVTLSAANGWKHTWEGLELSDEAYSVKEQPVGGYTSRITKSVNTVVQNGRVKNEVVFSIANTVIPKDSMQVKVIKAWSGEGNHPASVKVYLRGNGVNLSEAVLSAQNSWTHVWDGLDPDQEYTVAEAAIQGYTAKASIEESQSANATGGVDYVKIFRITNTKETKPTPTPAPTPSPTPAPTPEVTPVPRVDQLPQTGDSSNLSGLLMLMAFSAALSALFAVRRRKA